jgi:hypothetical protein
MTGVNTDANSAKVSSTNDINAFTYMFGFIQVGLVGAV